MSYGYRDGFQGKFKKPDERACATRQRFPDVKSRDGLRRLVIRSEVRWPKCPRHGCDLEVKASPWATDDVYLDCPTWSAE